MIGQHYALRADVSSERRAELFGFLLREQPGWEVLPDGKLIRWDRQGLVDTLAAIAPLPGTYEPYTVHQIVDQINKDAPFYAGLKKKKPGHAIIPIIMKNGSTIVPGPSANPFEGVLVPYWKGFKKGESKPADVTPELLQKFFKKVEEGQPIAPLEAAQAQAALDFLAQQPPSFTLYPTSECAPLGPFAEGLKKALDEVRRRAKGG